MSSPDLLTVLSEPQTERFVLANVLAKPDLMNVCRTALELIHFSIEPHRILWGLFSKLYDSGQGIGVQSVYNSIMEAKKSHFFKDMALSWLMDLQSESAEIGLESSIEILHDKLIRRQLYVHCNEIMRRCLTDEPVQRILDDVRAWSLSGLLTKTGEPESLEPVEARCGGPDPFLWPPNRSGLTLPLATLGKTLAGLHPGELTVLSGLTGTGKSSLASQITLSCGLHKVPVLLFTLEMTTEDVFRRMVYQLSGVSSDRVRNKTFSSREEGRVRNAIERIKNMPIYVESRLPSLPAIHAAIRRHRQAHGTGLVIIDHLHILRPTGRETNRNRQVGDMTRDVKLMASVEFHIPILLLAQLNRKVSERPGATPTLQDLRDSGEIEQHADNVLLIGSDGEDHSNGLLVPTRLEVAKQRNGRSKVVIPTYFRGDVFTFFEREAYDNPQEQEHQQMDFAVQA